MEKHLHRCHPFALLIRCLNGNSASPISARFARHWIAAFAGKKSPFIHAGSLSLCLLLAGLLAGCHRGAPAIQAKPQTLSFGAAPALTFPGSGAVTATASSGLAVSYSSTTPAVCTVDAVSGAVTVLAVGACSIAADQPGNAEYAPAAQALQTVTVTVNPAQTISFGAAPAIGQYGAGTVTATASSGLAVSYSSITPAVCTVDAASGEVLSLAAGNCIVAADQAGNAVYNAAPQATQTLAIPVWSGAITAPGAPVDVKATLGTAANTVSVSFTGPASSGGSPVTGYTVTSTPAGLTASGTASPITLNCAASCAGYAFSVAAGNNAGTGPASAAVVVLTAYQVTATFYEPDTQPNNTIFTGTFELDSTAGTVTSLRGTLSESMTHILDGQPMTTVALTHQLASASDGQGGLLVSAFALNSTHVYSEGGYAAGSQGLYYGYPAAANPAAGGTGNSYVTIYVNPADPLAPLSAAQINRLSYGDCAPGGMMGDVCMTGWSGIGTMGGYPVSQTISRQ